MRARLPASILVICIGTIMVLLVVHRAGRESPAPFHGVPEGVASPAPPPDTSQSEGAPNPPAGVPPWAESMSQLLSDTNLLDRLHAERDQQGSYAPDVYDDLRAQLALDPETERHFRSLILEKRTREAQLAFVRAWGRSVEAEEENEVERRIQTLLGESMYARYSAYERELPARGHVLHYQQKLITAGHPMTDSQKEVLVHLCRDAGFVSGEDAANPARALVAVRHESGATGKVLDSMSERFQQVLDGADLVLNDAQLQILTQNMNDRI